MTGGDTSTTSILRTGSSRSSRSARGAALGGWEGLLGGAGRKEGEYGDTGRDAFR